MFNHHPMCRSAIVLSQPTTFWDIKPGGCKDWREHRHLKKFFSALNSLAYIAPTEAVLIVVDQQDPCQSRIVREDLMDDLLQQVSTEVRAWSLSQGLDIS